VTYLYNQTRVHGNAKPGVKTAPMIDKRLPIYGPRFLPPSYLHQRKQSSRGDIKPEVAYLKPLNVVHPFYYKDLQRCPRCGATDETTWFSWTATGHREVHGLQREECAIGYQLRCGHCKKTQGEGGLTSSEKKRKGEDEQHCFATTSSTYWKKWSFSNIPRMSDSSIDTLCIGLCSALVHLGGVPIFFPRCGLTRELFDLIVEIRPSMTSGGLAENIKRMSNVLVFG